MPAYKHTHLYLRLNCNVLSQAIRTWDAENQNLYRRLLLITNPRRDRLHGDAMTLHASRCTSTRAQATRRGTKSRAADLAANKTSQGVSDNTTSKRDKDKEGQVQGGEEGGGDRHFILNFSKTKSTTVTQI